MTPPRIGRREALRLASGGLLLLSGCRENRANTVVVGSKNFTEQNILGELVAQQIEAHTNLKVDRRLNLGGTLICQQALLAGQLDLYVEYTGTALEAVLGDSSGETGERTGPSDPAEVFRRVQEGYRTRFDLIVGPLLGFNNTFAIVVRGDDARRLHLETISDLIPIAPHWHAGFGYEFMERADGYPGLVRAYGLMFASQPRIMDLGLLYRALKEKLVDVVAGNSTDGLILSLDMKALDDDRHYFPPYQAAPVVRAATLERHPELRGALDALGGKISDDQMRQMNYQVDGQYRDAAAVARDFRRSQKL